MKKSILFFLFIQLLVFGSVVSALNTSTSLSVDSAQVEQNLSTETENENGEDTATNEKFAGKPGDVLDAISFSNIFWTIVLIIIGYVMIKIFVKVLELFSERSAKFRITVKSIIPIIRIIIWSIVIFAIIRGIYNPPIETLIAMTASVAIAVGLAAQDLLKNVFGGIMLLFDRPFQVGDKIESGKYYGEVIQIGLRATRIVTPDDSTVSVPNMELMNTSVSNSNSGELNCQVVAEIYLPIDVDTQKVRKIATEAAQVSKYIFLNKPIVVVFFNEINNRGSYLKMRLKAYVMDIRYEFQFKSDMTEIVLKELLTQGIISKDDAFRAE
ncbi:MAG: mechanosensitive ion channel family protein [Bacteroidales bacterium]|nr:mechanosensitive ion channel family protein [Bacteroidales bacterium]